MRTDRLHELRFKRKVMRWRFPETPFVEFDAEDERRALERGWSGWGGEAVEVEQLYVFPRCRITGADESGIRFVAVPDYSSPA